MHPLIYCSYSHPIYTLTNQPTNETIYYHHIATIYAALPNLPTESTYHRNNKQNNQACIIIEEFLHFSLERSKWRLNISAPLISLHS